MTEEIKVTLHMSPTEIFDITEMVLDATWSGDINTFSRSLSLTVKNTQDMSTRLLKYGVSNQIYFYVNNEEIFRGYIFKLGLTSNGNETLTCYDSLIYATKNYETALYKNKTASDIISSICKKFNIPTGKIQPTGYKIKKKVADNQSLDSIFSDVLTETRTATNKGFILRSNKGKVDLYGRYNASEHTISVSDLFSASKEISMEDLRNKVLVTKGSVDTSDGGAKFVSRIATSASSINKYGSMQHIETVDDNATASEMSNKANSLLKELNQLSTVLSIEFQGDVKCITGNKISIRNPLIDVAGYYFITSDSHTWSNGSHKMNLQLSTKLE